MEFEESVIARLRDDGSGDADLILVADTGPLIAETDDEELYGKLKPYFDRTSTPESDGHFY